MIRSAIADRLRRSHEGWTGPGAVALGHLCAAGVPADARRHCRLRQSEHQLVAVGRSQPPAAGDRAGRAVGDAVASRYDRAGRICLRSAAHRPGDDRRPQRRARGDQPAGVERAAPEHALPRRQRQLHSRQRLQGAAADGGSATDRVRPGARGRRSLFQSGRCRRRVVRRLRSRVLLHTRRAVAASGPLLGQYRRPYPGPLPRRCRCPERLREIDRYDGIDALGAEHDHAR